MGDFLKGSWIPKLGSLISLAGTSALAMGQPWGVILMGVGQAIGFAAARQDGVTSEAVGLTPPPPVVRHVKNKKPQG